MFIKTGRGTKKSVPTRLKQSNVPNGVEEWNKCSEQLSVNSYQ
jgi:hypothetical protein